MNVYQKIIEVKKEADVFYKEEKKQGLSYRFVSGSQILFKIKDKMNEIGLLFMPIRAIHRSTIQYDYTTAANKEKTDFIVEGDLDYAWINADDPTDRHEIGWQYYGQQDEISKAFGSGLTYSERYLLLKSLGLPTDDDDPDSRDTSGNKKITSKATTPKQDAPKSDSRWGKLKDICVQKGKDFNKVLEKVDTLYHKRVVDLADDEWDKVYLPMAELPDAEVQSS
jgi:hypothetical protein